MKTFKIFSIMMCAVAALSLTSCLDDDDDDSNNGLTKEQVQQAFQQARGSYTGKMYYAYPDQTGQKQLTDSVVTSWTLDTDSTLTIHNFSLKGVGRNINDSALAKAFIEAPVQSMKCNIGFIRLSPVQFLINPTTVTLNGVEYNGGAHKVQAVFYANNLYSFGEYSSAGAIQMQIVFAGIFIDDKMQQNMLTSSQGVGFTFVGSR